MMKKMLAILAAVGMTVSTTFASTNYMADIEDAIGTLSTNAGTILGLILGIIVTVLGFFFVLKIFKRGASKA